MAVCGNYRKSSDINVRELPWLLISKRTSTRVNKKYKQSERCLQAGWDTTFVRKRKLRLPEGFRCSPKATDKPNVAVNTVLAKTTVLVPNLRTIGIAKTMYNNVRCTLFNYVHRPLIFCDFTVVDNQFPATVPEASFLSTTTLEKQSDQTTRRQFTFDDRNSTFDRENRVKTLTFTAKRWQSTSRHDNASFSTKLRQIVDNSLSRRCTKIISLRTFKLLTPTICATIAYWFSINIASLRPR